jgi:hypothetical protein
MSLYTHHRNTDAVQHVLVDVPPCHPGDLIPHDKQQKHTDVPQHRRVDVHSENSVRKKIFLVKVTNINIHENLSVGNFVTPYAKRN